MFLINLPSDILTIIISYCIDYYRDLLYVNKKIYRIVFKFLYGHTIYFDHIPSARSKEKYEYNIEFKIDYIYNTNCNNILNIYIESNLLTDNYYKLQINIRNNIIYFKASYNNIKFNNVIIALLKIAELMTCYNQKKTTLLKLKYHNRKRKKTIYIINKFIYVSCCILEMNNVIYPNNAFCINYKYSLLYNLDKNKYKIHKLHKDKKNKINAFIFKNINHTYFNCFTISYVDSNNYCNYIYYLLSSIYAFNSVERPWLAKKTFCIGYFKHSDNPFLHFDDKLKQIFH